MSRARRDRVRRGLLPALLAGLLGAACADRPDRAAPPPGEQSRAPCADRNPLRNLYFGDLHVHTSYSFDAHVFDVRATPFHAYRFARGEALPLPPLGPDGSGTQELRLDRPLDFAAVTDHAEFLGEVESCLVPGSRGYDTASCAAYRSGGTIGQAVFGAQTISPEPRRDESVCGADGTACSAEASNVWRRTVEAANDAYDRTARCSFTALVGYEYTANTGASSQHRNVIFASDRVPQPTTYVEQPTAAGLWRELRATCRDAGNGCDVLTIPHNPNQSNGRLLRVEYAPGSTLDEQRAQAAERAAFEPLVEIFQHKGDSECMNGLSGVLGGADEACGFEKLRSAPFEDCGDGVGNGGTANAGCVSRRDYVRGALLEGLAQEERIGANPLQLGIVASTDTHNGTPGAVAEQTFLGHRGNLDDLPDERLATMGARSGTVFNPGGLTGVWAEENTRSAIFAALARREVYGTSGPRITVRLFGGFGLAPGLCDDPALLEKAYADGVPMGGVLAASDAAGATAPSFVVSALRDPGTAEHAGTPLERVQIVKGWVADGAAHERVYDVAGEAGAGGVDATTCALAGGGFDALCAVWRDPDFDPARHAFYYARVLEGPSCRWNAWACRGLAGADRPASCDDPAVPQTIQERAWTSPIWYAPGA